MTNSKMNVTKGVVAGMVIGGTAGIALACALKKPGRNSFKTTALSAMETVGAVMQNLAEMSR